MQLAVNADNKPHTILRSVIGIRVANKLLSSGPVDGEITRAKEVRPHGQQGKVETGKSNRERTRNCDRNMRRVETYPAYPVICTSEHSD